METKLKPLRKGYPITLDLSMCRKVYILKTGDGGEKASMCSRVVQRKAAADCSKELTMVQLRRCNTGGADTLSRRERALPLTYVFQPL
ncbi:hypothetical protein UY3_18026 [Chelonia mydas]|uniref:Uncharacterized protein n=1 Tax=Chelonia mydas TaxID=8469 RepID=M7AQ78_CHEMY|nr:hypothetical protein UY3_18026 [Chelonia mydas]